MRDWVIVPVQKAGKLVLVARYAFQRQRHLKQKFS